MKKNFEVHLNTFRLCLCFAFVLLGCAGTHSGMNTPSQEKMALGKLMREDFVTPEYPKFKEHYDTMHVDMQAVEMIRTLHAGITYIVVLGTWCNDSKREVPRFLKIADLAHISPSDITFYGVDRTKTSSDGFTKLHSIELVPTFIISKNGEEVGRIVEAPKTTLETDLLSILADAYNK